MTVNLQELKLNLIRMDYLFIYPVGNNFWQQNEKKKKRGWGEGYFHGKRKRIQKGK